MQARQLDPTLPCTAPVWQLLPAFDDRWELQPGMPGGAQRALFPFAVRWGPSRHAKSQRAISVEVVLTRMPQAQRQAPQALSRQVAGTDQRRAKYRSSDPGEGGRLRSLLTGLAS